MNITKEQFQDFWNHRSQYYRINNAERFFRAICRKIEETGNAAGLDEYVCSLGSGRESVRKIIVDFYRYLFENTDAGRPDSILYEKRFFDHPFERQLEIAKYLHVPRTPGEIQEHFDINERTMRKDLSMLEDGITVMGSTVKIKKERKGRRYYYSTTMHPVFLPLNLTEVYALTVYLDHAIRQNDPNAEIIRDISERIKSQLSDYAFEKLFPEEERRTADNRYIDDSELALQRKGIYMYLMKSGQPCRFLWKGREYSGRIKWIDGEYRILLDNGEFLDARLEDTEFIIDSLKYK